MDESKPVTWTFPLDARATSMSIVSTSKTVGPIFATPDSINDLTAALPRSDATPDEVAALLDVARKLLATSVIHYEFAAVAAEKSLQAVELAVRHRSNLSEKQYKGLINRLASAGEIDDATKDVLHEGRELRNMFSHPKTALAFPLVMMVNLIAASHRLVVGLYPDSERIGT